MAIIRTLEELDALYDVPVPTSIIKEVDHLTPLHCEYVAASPFVIVASAGPNGLDCSPRGDPAGFVRIVDERTLMLPDRRGNNRLDTIRNLVRDPRIALLFLIPGIGMTLRVNGTAVITTDPDLCESFRTQGKVPATVIVVTTQAVYTQCPKALIRSRLWDPSLHRDASELPTSGQIMEHITGGDFDGAAHDAAYPARPPDDLLSTLMDAAPASTPPTAELHVHIEGTLEVEAVFAIAARNGVPPPAADVSELRSRYEFGNLQSFLDLYYENVAVLQTERDFYDLADSYLARVARANVRRAEMFFDPQTHLANGVPLAAVMGGLYAAAQDATRRHGVSAALIMCFLRHLGVDAADEMLTASLAHRDQFIGVGLDSTEIGFPNPLFERVFARAAAEGLRLVAHAAEEGEPATVTETLDALRVERIDHGVRAMEDGEVVARLRAEQVPLTVCPLSNVRLKVVPSLAAHPIARMLDAGLCATVNSDDPAYFGGYVDDNYRAVQTELDLSQEQLQQLALNSFDACFAERLEREAWKQEVRDWTAR